MVGLFRASGLAEIPSVLVPIWGLRMIMRCAFYGSPHV